MSYCEGPKYGPYEGNDRLDAIERRTRNAVWVKTIMADLDRGLTMEQAAARNGLTMGQAKALIDEIVYPAKSFAATLTPEELATQRQQRATINKVWKEARVKNITYSEAARRMGYDPQEINQIYHELKIFDTVNYLDDIHQRVVKFNKAAEFAVAQGPTIAETGAAIGQAAGPTYREDIRTTRSTFETRISEAEGYKLKAEVLEGLAELKKIATLEAKLGNGITAAEALQIKQQTDYWTKHMNKWAPKFFTFATASGRIQRSLQNLALPDTMLDFMRKSGVSLEGWRQKNERTPIYTSFLDIPNWKNLSAQQQREIQNNAVDAVRLNLFPVTTSTLDAMLNAAETGVQLVAGLGADMGYAMKTGRFSMPNTRAARMAWNNMRSDVAHRLYSPEFESTIGISAMGEPISGSLKAGDVFKKPTAEGGWLDFFRTGHKGAFTERGTQASAALDTLAGLPLYTKASVDSAFKRFSGAMSMYADAIKAADSAGISPSVDPVRYKQFIKDYWTNIPKAALDRAIDTANAAGFNRDMPAVIDRMSRSKMGQLFVDAFGRFSWQFLRWSGDMLGADPKMWKKIASGVSGKGWNIGPEELMRYLTRTATGIGGIAMLDGMLYDKMDYNSMEKVNADGNRVRLAGREPIATALFLSALARGAMGEEGALEKAHGAMRYASFPLLKALYGEGGLVSGVIKNSALGAAQGKFFDSRTRDEVIDLINHAIPGQAVLSALKAGLDTEVREGFGANLPGVSLLKDPKIDLTSGAPAEVNQRFPGTDISIRTIQGAPVPGMVREMQPIAKMLMRYGEITYRGPRQSLAGVTPDEAPPDAKREWQVAFGRNRASLMNRLMPTIEAMERSAKPEDMQPGKPGYERVRKLIKMYDSMAAKAANREVDKIYGTAGKKPPRQLTAREVRMPEQR